MPRRPRSIVDPEVRRNVVTAIQRDLERDYENMRPELEKLDLLERIFLKARTDQPDHRPIERELMLAYFARRRRDLFPLYSAGVDPSSELSLVATQNYWYERGEDRKQLWVEVRELEGLLWGKQKSQQMREAADRIWNDEFWTDLRKLGVPPRDALRTIDSLIPPARGRPITKQPLAVKALQLKLAGNQSWAQVTRQFCDCGKQTHDLRCQDRLKKEVKAVQKILSKYGLDFPTPQQRQRPSS